MNRSTRRTVVVQGGTDGIGREVVRALEARGDRVVVLGRDPTRGAEFTHFLPADLSLVAENQRVVEEIEKRFDTVDALVPCARHYRATRLTTRDGFEHNFALFYLSRFLLSHGLLPALERAPAPVVLNVAGPGTPLDLVHWDDLQLARGYEGQAAMFQGGVLNDLLGVDFAGHGHRTRYALFHPGTTATGFSGEYDRDTLAFVERRRIGVHAGSFDAAAAARLRALADRLLSPFRDPAGTEPPASAP